MLPSELLRLDSASTEDMLTDAAVHVLAEKGAAGLTTKAIADWLRVTPARVSQLVRRENWALPAWMWVSPGAGSSEVLFGWVLQQRPTRSLRGRLLALDLPVVKRGERLVIWCRMR